MTDTDLRNKRVLIREDLNVPVQNGTVTVESEPDRGSKFIIRLPVARQE